MDIYLESSIGKEIPCQRMLSRGITAMRGLKMSRCELQHSLCCDSTETTSLFVRTSRLHVDSRCYVQILQEAASLHAPLSRSSRCSKPIPIAFLGTSRGRHLHRLVIRDVHAVSIEQTAHFLSRCLPFCCIMSEDDPRLPESPAKVDGRVKQTCLSSFSSYGGVLLQRHFAYAHEQAQLT